MFTVNDLIGIPYKTNGTPDGSFHDCWSIVLEVYKRAGVDLGFGFIDFRNPRIVHNVMQEQAPNWNKVPFEDRTFLDLVVFSTSRRLATHVGVTLSKGTYIHCQQSTGVVIGKFNRGIQSALIKGIYRWKC